MVGYLILEVPYDSEDGDIYYLSYENVSGTTDDFNLIEIEGLIDVPLSVVYENNAPEFGDFEDVHIPQNGLKKTLT